MCVYICVFCESYCYINKLMVIAIVVIDQMSSL